MLLLTLFRSFAPPPSSPGENARITFTGKVLLEIEILPKDSADQQKNSNGRKAPNEYPVIAEPNRPADSFLWILNPLKALKYILWKNYWKQILCLICLGFVILAVYVFAYTAPETFAKVMMMFGIPPEWLLWFGIDIRQNATAVVCANLTNATWDSGKTDPASCSGDIRHGTLVCTSNYTTYVLWNNCSHVDYTVQASAGADMSLLSTPGWTGEPDLSLVPEGAAYDSALVPDSAPPPSLIQ